MTRHIAAVVVGLVFASGGWVLAMVPDWSASGVEQVFAAWGGFCLGVLAAWGWQGLVDADRRVDRLIDGDVDDLDDLAAAFDREVA